MRKARLTVGFHFESAHRMPNFPEGHPNARLHGHSYAGEAVLEGAVDPETGFVADYDVVKKLVEEAALELDHRYLNDVPGVGLPTSENLARWLYERLRKPLPQLQSVVIRRGTLGMSVTYPID